VAGEGEEGGGIETVKPPPGHMSRQSPAHFDGLSASPPGAKITDGIIITGSKAMAITIIAKTECVTVRWPYFRRMYFDRG
jgi:hypothetical protein